MVYVRSPELYPLPPLRRGRRSRHPLTPAHDSFEVVTALVCAVLSLPGCHPGKAEVHMILGERVVGQNVGLTS